MNVSCKFFSIDRYNNIQFIGNKNLFGYIYICIKQMCYDYADNRNTKYRSLGRYKNCFCILGLCS